MSRRLSPASSPKAKRARMETEPEGSSSSSPSIFRPGGNIGSGGGSSLEQSFNLGDEGMEEGEPDNPDGPLMIPENAQMAAVESQILPTIKYEYLDHTADVQIHAWGDNLAEAFEQCAMGMFGYITDLERVDNLGSELIQASGHDMLSLLFGFLDEWLFVFNAEPYFVARKISITSFDRENFRISAIGYGETFNLAKHTQGTEVKAITYSNMQFHEKEGYAEVFVIIDI